MVIISISGVNTPKSCAVPHMPLNMFAISLSVQRAIYSLTHFHSLATPASESYLADGVGGILKHITILGLRDFFSVLQTRFPVQLSVP